MPISSKPKKSDPAPSPDGAPPPLGLALGGLLAMAAALGVGRFVYTPILPLMLEGLELSKADGGIIASANYLGYLLGALAASKAVLPGSRRGWLLGALAVSTATTGAMGGFSGLSGFLVLRFAGGFASAFVLVFASALVLERLMRAGRQGLSALHFGGVGVGIAVSAVLVSALAGEGFGWRSQWMAAGAFSLVAWAAVFLLIPAVKEELPGAAAGAGSTGEAGRGNRRLLLLVVAYGLFGFGYVITATFVSTMVRASPELRSIESTVWLMVGLAAMPSVACWNWAGRRMGHHRAFALASLVEAAGVGLSVLTVSAPAVLGAAALLGGTFMGLTALGLMHARELSGGDPRRSMAFMTAAFGLGQMIGPAFAGFAYDLTGSLRVPSLVAAGGLVVAAALALATAPRGRAGGAGRDIGGGAPGRKKSALPERPE